MRREEARSDTGYRPFRAGRLTLRGNLTGFEGSNELVQLVYQTQDFRARLTPGRTRLSYGHEVLGWHSDVFTSLPHDGGARYGIELSRSLGERARVRVLGGGTAGGGRGGPDALDIFELTGERAFALVAYERRF
jgi:hypothetical protein